MRNPVSVNVSPKQTQAHPVDSLSHTPTLRQRLMEPPRVPFSPHRYPHPGATSTPSSMALSSTSATGSSKTATGPGISKGSRPQQTTPAKTIPSAQTRAGPISPLASTATSTARLEDAQMDLPSSQSQRLSASQTHPSIQQALQLEQVAEPQSVKSLLAKKLSNAGNPDLEQAAASASGVLPPSAIINSGLAAGADSGFHQQPVRAPSQSHFKVSNTLENHQPITPSSASQANHIQQHLAVTAALSSTPSACLTAPTMGRFVIAQPSHSATPSVGNSTMSGSLANSVLNQNSIQSGGELQQNVALAPDPLQQNMNQNSIVLSQNHGPQSALYTNNQVVANNFQQNGPVSQVATFLSAQSQQPQPVQLQLRPSSTTTVPGNTFVSQNSGHILQNQPQNGPNQLNSSFPATVVKKVTVGQQQQNTPNLVSSSVSVSTGSVLRTASHGMPLAGQQLARTTMAVQGTSLTQAISSPAVAALLTSNNHQASSQMIISSPMLSGTGQGQIVARPPQQQVPTTVVIQTPPGTIVMPSRQMQGGTVSFIVPPQYRQGSPVTFIQQQPAVAAGNTTGVNMLPSLAIANPGGGQPIQAQQRQIVLATPGQNLPVGMQLSSLQGNTIIRNHPVCINSMQQQPQQHNYVIQASSSQLLSSTQASSQQSPSYQVIPQQNPQVAGAVVSNNNLESQQARSEAGVSAQQSSMPSVVMQQVHCNGSVHDQNGVQRSPDLLITSDSPPSPVSKSEKEMLNGKGSNTDSDNEHIKSGYKLGGKMNGLVHSAVTEHSKEASPTPMQTNSAPHGTVLVNGNLPQAGLPNQHANIPIQGLQVRAAAGGIVNGVSQAPAVGPLHQVGNGLQNQQPVIIHQQQQQKPQQFVQQSHHAQLPSQQAQVSLQPRQQLQVQQNKPQQSPVNQSQSQINFHQGQNQVVQIQQQPAQPPPQFQRVVTVRPTQPAPNLVQPSQGVIRPRISTLSCPLDQQQQQLQQALQAGPRPAGLPRSGSAPIGEAGGNVSSLTNTLKGTSSGPVTPVPTAAKKRTVPAKPVVNTPVSEAAGRLRKKKPGPNEVVVTPGSVQTRKQAQGQKPVHIAMQYMCEWGSCRK